MDHRLQDIVLRWLPVATNKALKGSPIVEGGSPITMVSFAFVNSVPALNRLEAPLVGGLVSV